MAAVSFGKRIGDGTTEAVERLNKVGTANSIAVTLADVERALEKLEDGTYGICDSCGEPIGEERLEAIPWATLCISCARIARPGSAAERSLPLGAGIVRLGGSSPLGPDHLHRGVDQREVGERLREVPEVAARPRIELLGVEAERARQRQELLAAARARRPARRSRRARRPARTSRSRTSPPPRWRARRRSRPPGSGGPARCPSAPRRSRRPWPASADRRAAGTPAAPRAAPKRRASTIPYDSHEDATFVDAVLQDVGLDLVGDRPPSVDEVDVAHRLGQERAAVQRHPAHDLRGREVARLPAVLPDPAVGLGPAFDRALDLALQVLPGDAGEELAGARVEVHRV